MLLAKRCYYVKCHKSRDFGIFEWFLMKLAKGVEMNTARGEHGTWFDEFQCDALHNQLLRYSHSRCAFLRVSRATSSSFFCNPMKMTLRSFIHPQLNHWQILLQFLFRYTHRKSQSHLSSFFIAQKGRENEFFFLVSGCNQFEGEKWQRDLVAKLLAG